MPDDGPSVPVRAILEGRSESLGLDLELIAGRDGLDRRITIPHVQKTGLALAGFDEYLRPGRVLVFGESEIRYLEGLPEPALEAAIGRAFARDLPCVIITGGFDVASALVAAADAVRLPVLRTALTTPTAIAKLTTMLEDRLAVRQIVHGVLLDILGLGVLVIGESGIGKSECALDLVVRGHRLVADDAVEVRRRAETVLIGSCPELTRHHMEIRGLGVINVRELFGVASTRTSKRVELVVQLERWEPGREYDRLGLDDPHHELLGCRIPFVRMPVAPGRNVAILVEVAARNQLLRTRGRNAARDLADRVDQGLLAPIDDDPDDEAEPGEGA
jgi:HPr kinase/phosphorylase